jgi:hypothetical protein
MSGTPITLNLYDSDDNVIKTLSRSVIPWGILKKAVRLMRKINTDNLSEQDVDEIAGLVVTIFGDKVTIDDLDKGADTSDMVATIMQIVTKAESLMPNPPIPGP